MKINKTNNFKYNFKNIEFDIINGNLNFENFVKKFLKETKIKKGYLSVIVNIKQINDQYFAIGNRFPLQIKNKESISEYIDYLHFKYLHLENRYKVIEPVTIFFNYTPINEESYKHSETLLHGKNKAFEKLNKLSFKNELPANLPLNTNYSTWGTVERLGSNILKIKEISSNTLLNNKHRYIHINFLNKHNRIIEIYSSSNILLNKVTDKIINPFGNEFIRQVEDKIYHIKDNTIFFVFENLYLDYKNITKARLAKKFIMNMLTLDIETYKNKDKTMSVYCISIYDGKNCFSYYLTDYNSINDLMQTLLNKLFSREYAQKTIYIHNSSNFDLIFLLKYIVNRKGILLEPLIKDGKFINLKVKYGPNFNYYVNFKDSYLILPDSLENLTKNFKVENLKSTFPHDFVKETNLNYIGKVPSFYYFNSTSLKQKDYLNYTLQFKDNWNLKEIAIKYCENDCIALYQTIMNFSNLIFNQFNINVSSISTLPSLAFKIFRANYLAKNIKLPVIAGKIYSDISQAYYGGHCDIYKPTNPKGTLVYEYDCNSLFPFVMRNLSYPGKILGYFRGDISSMNEYSKLYNQGLSFLKVKITAPKNLKNPILPNRSNNVAIYGVGTWTGWFYSEELKNAEKYNYKYEILEGYIFEPTTIFTEYVNKIFQIKLKSDANNPMYIISKLLLNTLYGRFGLSPNQLTHEVVTNNNINQRINELNIENLQNIISFGDNYIISYSKSFSKIPLINVGIAAAISANARVYMTEFKNNPNYILLYTDTDSYFTLNPLPSHLVDDKKLGHFKLVHLFKEFVALAPKVYGGIDTKGNQVIKTKGLKSNLTFSQLKNLLNEKIFTSTNKTNIFTQTKWFNNLEKGTIVEKEINYNLKPTDNKRNLVYKNGIFVDTTNKLFEENN